MEVAAGTSDACVIDKTMADAMTGAGTSYADLGYELSLSSEDYVVGFRKDSDAADMLTALFEIWKVDGTLIQLSAKYDNAVSVAESTLTEDLVDLIGSALASIDFDELAENVLSEIDFTSIYENIENLAEDVNLESLASGLGDALSGLSDGAEAK